MKIVTSSFSSSQSQVTGPTSDWGPTQVKSPTLVTVSWVLNLYPYTYAFIFDESREIRIDHILWKIQLNRSSSFWEKWEN